MACDADGGAEGTEVAQQRAAAQTPAEYSCDANECREYRDQVRAGTDSRRNMRLEIAVNRGAALIITRVLATLVNMIEVTNKILLVAEMKPPTRPYLPIAPRYLNTSRR